jgi:hypothetical protein
VSHTAGQDAVASQVVFQHGRPSKKHYRKYAIKSPAVALGHSDDYEAIREVIRRRFAGYADNHNHDDADVNVEKNGGGSDFSTEGTTKATAKKTTTKKKKKKKKSNAQPLPDLLLIDGGKGQLSAAMEALAECGLTTEAADATGGGSSSGSGSSGSSGGAAGRSHNGVWHDGRCMAVVALAKREEEVFLPGEGAALEALNNPQAPAMLLLRQVRDEAHRFALTYHRRRRAATAMKRSNNAPGGSDGGSGGSGGGSPAFSSSSSSSSSSSYGSDFEGDGVYGLRDDDPELAALARVRGLTLPKRRALLLDLGSLADVAAAPERRLRAVPGIGPTLAARLRDHFAAFADGGGDLHGETESVFDGAATATATATATAVTAAAVTRTNGTMGPPQGLAGNENENAASGVVMMMDLEK